jgi:hypothetical protein
VTGKAKIVSGLWEAAPQEDVTGKQKVAGSTEGYRRGPKKLLPSPTN